MLHICNDPAFLITIYRCYPAKRTTLKSAVAYVYIVQCQFTVKIRRRRSFGNNLSLYSQTTCYSLKSIELADKRYQSRQSSHKIHWNVESPKIPGQVPVAAYGSFRSDGERVSYCLNP